MRDKEEIRKKIEMLKGALSITWGEADECEDAEIEGMIKALEWVLEEREEI